MKAFILSILSCAALVFSMPALADKVTISGQPVAVHEDHGVYVPATTVVADKDYYYFNIGDTRRVCYQDVNPSLVNLDYGTYKVKLGDEVVSMYCYQYSPEYFVVQ